jgi:hypothetical protein
MNRGSFRSIMSIRSVKSMRSLRSEETGGTKEVNLASKEERRIPVHLNTTANRSE